MEGTAALDTAAALGRPLLQLVESGGLLLGGLAFAGALATAFCLGRLIERAVTELHETPRIPPPA